MTNKEIFKPRNRMLEGFLKSQLVDAKGNILLPRTTASMVSEEPNRRFLDSEEKAMIYEMSIKKDEYLSLVRVAPSLVSLANREQEIINLVESSVDWQDVESKLERLEPILTYQDQLIEIAKNDLFAMSPTTLSRYFISIDDTDPLDPKIKLTIDDSRVSEPFQYKAGDTWEVPALANDVKVKIPFSKIVQAKDKDVVLMLSDIQNLDDSSEPEKDNVRAGSALTVTAKSNTAIGQASVSFDVQDYLTEAFGNSAIHELITRFKLNVLIRPDSIGTIARAQIFRNKEVVSPIRPSINKDNFELAEFNSLTWSVSHDDAWLNGEGKAHIVVYGGRGSGMSMASPYLEVDISNPYKGKTLVAEKDMDKEFNILDWRVKE